MSKSVVHVFGEEIIGAGWSHVYIGERKAPKIFKNSDHADGYVQALRDMGLDVRILIVEPGESTDSELGLYDWKNNRQGLNILEFLEAAEEIHLTTVWSN